MPPCWAIVLIIAGGGRVGGPTGHNPTTGNRGCFAINSKTVEVGVESSARLDPPVIDRRASPLLAAPVAFSRLNRNISEKKLDPFQLSSRGVT